MSEVKEMVPPSNHNGRRSKTDNDAERLLHMLEVENSTIEELISGINTKSEMLKLVPSYDTIVNFALRIDAWTELARYASQYIEHVSRPGLEQIELKLKTAEFEWWRNRIIHAFNEAGPARDGKKQIFGPGTRG